MNSPVVPRPLRFDTHDGHFLLDQDTTLDTDAGLERSATWLRETVGRATGFPLEQRPLPRDPGDPGDPGGGIVFRSVPGMDAEEYRLDVTEGGVLIEAGGPAGAFYGAQTLRQLLDPAVYRAGRVRTGPWTIPAVTVADRPRFPWRGCLIDVARHFLPKHDLLRYIDLLALHKLNVLHLHLTDDQGWRLEIKRYPRLTQVGAWRRRSPLGAMTSGLHDDRPHGGYYTHDDIREIVAYAADRFVTVVPEIDIPGHTQAAIAAYPELGNLPDPLEVGTEWGVGENVLNVEESTVGFFKDVFDEVLALFPGEYVSLGGDECPKAQWRNSLRAKERMRELGLQDTDQLQSWFVGRFAAYLIERGRKPYGWDEILEGGLPPGTTVAAWRGTVGAVQAVRQGHEVVTSPFGGLYLDFRQTDDPDEPVPIGSVTSLRDVHAFEPVPAGLTADEAGLVIGAQAGLWTEHIDSPRGLDYMAFPRLSAFAETVWSPPTGPPTGPHADPRDGGREEAFADFERRLRVHEQRLDALGVEYRPHAGPHPWQTRPDAPGDPRTTADIQAKIDTWTANIVERQPRPHGQQ